jgi:hypothetical protein
MAIININKEKNTRKLTEMVFNESATLKGKKTFEIEVILEAQDIAEHVKIKDEVLLHKLEQEEKPVVVFEAVYDLQDKLILSLNEANTAKFKQQLQAPFHICRQHNVSVGLIYENVDVFARLIIDKIKKSLTKPEKKQELERMVESEIVYGIRVKKNESVKIKKLNEYTSGVYQTLNTFIPNKRKNLLIENTIGQHNRIEVLGVMSPRTGMYAIQAIIRVPWKNLISGVEGIEEYALLDEIAVDGEAEIPVILDASLTGDKTSLRIDDLEVNPQFLIDGPFAHIEGMDKEYILRDIENFIRNSGYLEDVVDYLQYEEHIM